MSGREGIHGPALEELVAESKARHAEMLVALADQEPPPALPAAGRVDVHPTAIIHPGVTLGAGTVVGPHCILGSADDSPLTIGERSIIRAASIIYGGSEYGPGLETTGHFTLLRAGNTVGDNLRVGSYSSLEGNATLGDFVRIHGRCEMTKGVLRDFSRLYGGTYVTDNRRPPSYVNAPCVLEEGSVVAMGCILVAGIRLGVGSYVAAGVVVDQDVPDGHMLRRDGSLRLLRDLWPPRYQADYPERAQARLAQLHMRMEVQARALAAGTWKAAA